MNQLNYSRTKIKKHKNSILSCQTYPGLFPLDYKRCGGAAHGSNPHRFPSASSVTFEGKPSSLKERTKYPQIRWSHKNGLLKQPLLLITVHFQARTTCCADAAHEIVHSRGMTRESREITHRSLPRLDPNIPRQPITFTNNVKIICLVFRDWKDGNVIEQNKAFPSCGEYCYMHIKTSLITKCEEAACHLLKWKLGVPAQTKAIIPLTFSSNQIQAVQGEISDKMMDF